MRRLRGRLCLGAALALALLVVPAGAQASLHPFIGGTGAYENPCGVAVAPDGTRYVSDYLNTTSSTPTQNAPCALGIDSGGRVFANNFHGSVELLGTGVLDAGRSTGVAVDRATDTVYVTHRTHVSTYAAPALPGEAPTTIGSGALTDAYGAAVSGFPGTLGYLYVADAATDTVEVFDPATDPLNPVLEIDGSETPLGELRDLTDTALAIDDSNGHLLVLDNVQPGFEHPLARVYEFDATGNYLGQIAHWVEVIPQPPPAPAVKIQHVLIHGGPSGLAVDNSIDPDTGKPRGTIYVGTGNELNVIEGLLGLSEVANPLYSFCAAAACPATPSFVLEAAKAGDGQGTVTSLLPGLNAGASLPGIACGIVCATEYDQGTQVSLIATPRPHSAFTGWTGGGCSGAGPCKVAINGDTEVTANFTAIPQRTLTVAKSGTGEGTVTSSPAGIDCGSACDATFDQGSTATLTAEAAVGSEFTGWSGACSGTGACKVSMGSNQSVGAEFRQIPRIPPVDRNSGRRTLAISVSGEGAGTIASDPPGVDCGTPCSGAYAPGTKVTLTAKPDEESSFSGWSGCDSQMATTCTVTMGSSRTVGASFAEATPLELAGLSLNGAKALLSVVVPSRGTLRAKAKQLQPVSVKARKAETLSVPLTLNKAAKKTLAKKGKLKVKVSLTFKPSGGGPAVSLEKTIVFRDKKGGK